MSDDSDATLKRFTESLAKTVMTEVERRMREILREAVSRGFGEFYTDANGLQQWRWLERQPAGPHPREPRDDDFLINARWVAKDDPGYTAIVVEATANFVVCSTRTGQWRIPRQTFVETFRPWDEPSLPLQSLTGFSVSNVGTRETIIMPCKPQSAF